VSQNDWENYGSGAWGKRGLELEKKGWGTGPFWDRNDASAKIRMKDKGAKRGSVAGVRSRKRIKWQTRESVWGGGGGWGVGRGAKKKKGRHYLGGRCLTAGSRHRKLLKGGSKGKYR